MSLLLLLPFIVMVLSSSKIHESYTKIEVLPSAVFQHVFDAFTQPWTNLFFHD